MKAVKGYEGEEIIIVEDEEVKKILHTGTPRDIIKLYLELKKAWYFQTNRLMGEKAYEQANILKQKVQELLVRGENDVCYA